MSEEFCKFSKFGFCKFGRKCRRKHFNLICEHNFCENVKTCDKRHPRNCYYFFAYGYCKFGLDCQFHHGKKSSQVTPANDKQNIIEKNGALQKEIKEITKKNEELKVHLDELMENQSKHDVINKNFIEKEIEKFRNEFVQVLNDQQIIIISQEKKIHNISSEVVELKQENLKLKLTKIYACEYCNFESTEKCVLLIHRKNDHADQFENESESENEESDDDYSSRPTYQCDLCTYSSTYPDNVAFHYGEKHDTKMNWEEAERNLKR